MASARAIFQAHVDDLFEETVPIDFSWVLPNSSATIQLVNFTIGDNTLTIPALTKVIGIKPPMTNAAALKVKGAGGDTGFTLYSSLPNVFTWSSGTVIINASVAVTGVTLVFL